MANHRCNNPKCVRVEHLEVTDHAGNMDHMSRCGRHGRAKLSVRDVQEIRRAWAAPDRPLQQEIARRHGVDRTTVSKLVTGQTWRSLRRR